MPCCHPNNRDDYEFSSSENNKKENNFDQNNSFSRLHQESAKLLYRNKVMDTCSASKRKKLNESQSLERKSFSSFKPEFRSNFASQGFINFLQHQAKFLPDSEIILSEDSEEVLNIAENQNYDLHSRMSKNSALNQDEDSSVLIQNNENFYFRQKQENSQNYKQIEKFKSSNGSILRRGAIDELSERLSIGINEDAFKNQIIKKCSSSQQNIEFHNMRNSIKESISISRKSASWQSQDVALRRSSNLMGDIFRRSVLTENLKVNEGPINQVPISLNDDKHFVELNNVSSQISNSEMKEFNAPELMKTEYLVGPNMNATSNKKYGFIGKFYNLFKSTFNSIDTIGYNMTNANIATYGNKKRGS
jgi:hypothetical protein